MSVFDSASARIAEAFAPVHYVCNVREGSCGAFVDIIVVSAAFEGGVRLQASCSSALPSW